MPIGCLGQLASSLNWNLPVAANGGCSHLACFIQKSTEAWFTESHPWPAAKYVPLQLAGVAVAALQEMMLRQHLLQNSMWPHHISFQLEAGTLGPKGRAASICSLEWESEIIQ